MSCRLSLLAKRSHCRPIFFKFGTNFHPVSKLFQNEYLRSPKDQKVLFFVRNRFQTLFNLVQPTSYTSENGNKDLKSIYRWKHPIIILQSQLLLWDSVAINNHWTHQLRCGLIVKFPETQGSEIENKAGDTIFPCASRGFQSGDLGSTPRAGDGVNPMAFIPCQFHLYKVSVVRSTSFTPRGISFCDPNHIRQPMDGYPG